MSRDKNKFAIRYCILQQGQRVVCYYVNHCGGTVHRSPKISEAQLFDTKSGAEMYLKSPEVKAGLAKIIELSGKDIFRMKLNGG